MRGFVIAAFGLALMAACGPSQPAPQAPSATAPQSQTPDFAAQQARIAALAPPYNEASYEAGRRVFAQCRSCHTTAADGGNRVGPNLHGVFDRAAGAAPGFTYSQALQNADFIWDAEHLDNWLANPQTFLPGNRMAFAGVRDAVQRRDVIAYLMVESQPAP
ncbi:MAG: cytochrome c family protein [Hyphomonadaceae bacterium]|nr:cytochrome c family protein [Hyphomonadaceae bacterium]